jgi:hypothetical protein
MWLVSTPWGSATFNKTKEGGERKTKSASIGKTVGEDSGTPKISTGKATMTEQRTTNRGDEDVAAR